MHSQVLFGIFIAVSLFIAMLFLWRKDSSVLKPNRLYFKKQKSYRDVPAVLSQETLAESKITAQEKNLNVLFMYNGHSFDAHEVLGIPAGANRKMVEEAYALATSKMSSDSREFLQAAYQALMMNLN